MTALFDEDRVNQILAMVKDELRSATAANGKMASAHEGYAVILEELDELWDEVRKRHTDAPAMFREAIQTAAMAVRFLHDIVYNPMTAMEAGYAVRAYPSR